MSSKAPTSSLDKGFKSQIRETLADSSIVCVRRAVLSGFLYIQKNFVWWWTDRDKLFIVINQAYDENKASVCHQPNETSDVIIKTTQPAVSLVTSSRRPCWCQWRALTRSFNKKLHDILLYLYQTATFLTNIVFVTHGTIKAGSKMYLFLSVL